MVRAAYNDIACPFITTGIGFPIFKTDALGMLYAASHVLQLVT